MRLTLLQDKYMKKAINFIRDNLEVFLAEYHSFGMLTWTLIFYLKFNKNSIKYLHTYTKSVNILTLKTHLLLQ